MEIGKLYRFTNNPYDWELKGKIISALCKSKYPEEAEFDYLFIIVYLNRNEIKTIDWGVKLDDVVPVPFEDNNMKKYNFSWGKNGLSNKT